ncbi:MAG: lipopolysaccharide biosynthesis protein [Bacteroidales bacterium]
MESLKTRTARGMFWSFLDSFGVYLVRFGFSIVIARTLSPEDYGLMGMIVIFIALGQMLMQGGFSMALIQKKDSDETDFSTVFWFNAATAVVVYIILFFSAGAIASFFGKPVLVSITRVAAIGIILNALSSVHVSLLTKKMDFRKLTWINLSGAVISGSTGLVMALKGFEVWALVFQTLAGNLISLAGLWISSGWRPRLVFGLDSFRSLFSFGYKVLLQGLTDVIFTRIYFPLIGKLFPVAQLGFYTNASRFHEIFIRQTANSVTRVIFPAFSTIQDEREKFSSNYIKSFNMLALLMFLGSLVLIVSSRPFVSLALTDKWLPAVPFMQIFFIEGFFFPLMMFNQNILYSAGLGSAALRIDLGRKAVILVGIIILYRYGIEALIAGQVASTLLALLFTQWALTRSLGIKTGSVMVPLLKLLAITGVCFAFSFYIIDPPGLSDWLQLLLKVTLVPVLFLGLSVLSGIDSPRELVKLIGGLRNRVS